ncbi:hypothetical protein [Azospirillum sp. sgz301742]
MGTSVTTNLGNTYVIPGDNETDWGEAQVGPALVELLQYALLEGGDVSLLKLVGPLVTTPVSLTVDNGSTVPSSAPCYFLTGLGGPVALSTITPIAAGTYPGQHLILVGRSSIAPVTVPDSGNVNINGSCDLEQDEALVLLWTGTAWVELSRTF